MDIAKINSVVFRTDQKLEFAYIHLQELKAIERHGYSSYEVAHQESFLFHLFGAKDAFLAELNEYYQCNLDSNNITLGKLRSELEQRDVISLEVKEIYLLEQNSESWLSNAKNMRDHAAHVHGIPLTIEKVGNQKTKLKLRNPKTDEETGADYIESFSAWLNEMINLIMKLRKSSQLTCNVKL